MVLATLLGINDAKICAPVYFLRFISVKIGDFEVSGLPETIKYSMMVKNIFMCVSCIMRDVIVIDENCKICNHLLCEIPIGI